MSFKLGNDEPCIIVEKNHVERQVEDKETFADLKSKLSQVLEKIDTLENENSDMNSKIEAHVEHFLFALIVGYMLLDVLRI